MDGGSSPLENYMEILNFSVNFNGGEEHMDHEEA